MVTFSVKNIQVGHPKNTNIEKKFDRRKKFFCFVLNVFKTIKKKKKNLVTNTGWTQNFFFCFEYI